MGVKDIVRSSYRNQASLYASSDRMQTGNLRKLVDYAVSCGVQFKKGSILDLGCGTGILVRELRERFGNPSLEYHGLDLADEMIRIAEQLHPDAGEFLVGDAEALPFGAESMDVVLANSVLHWLNVPELGQTPRQALQEAFRVLKPGGFLAISVSGYGTARRFQASYHRVMEGLTWVESNPRYRQDPIGSITLADLVDMLMEVGFQIMRAQLDYEPVRYEHPKDYVRDAKAYAYDIYLSAIPEERREPVWAKVDRDFVSSVGQGEYVHDQYMIYAVGRRPP